MQDFIKTITREAGGILMKHFGKVGIKYTKQDESDVVTIADIEANEYLVNKIKKEYPDHGIISEEDEKYKEDAEYVWTIDPLDGTLNFATHTPIFGTMISVMKNREVIHACVYSPSTDEMVYAEKGKGTELNGKKVHCSTKEDLKHSYGIMTSRMSEKGKGLHMALINECEGKIINVNQLGCMAIGAIYLADGRRDWKIGRGAKIWDYAPTYLILTESGHKATALDGSPWTPEIENMLVANPVLHQKLLEMISHS